MKHYKKSDIRKALTVKNKKAPISILSGSSLKLYRTYTTSKLRHLLKEVSK